MNVSDFDQPLSCASHSFLVSGIIPETGEQSRVYFEIDLSLGYLSLGYILSQSRVYASVSGIRLSLGYIFEIFLSLGYLSLGYPGELEETMH